MECIPQDRPRVKNTRILRERIEKFISPIYFSDVNLFSKLYCHVGKIESIYHYKATGRISYEEALSHSNEFKPVKIVEQSFGPTWSTHWFRIDIDLSINDNWKGKEVRLRWNSGTEALIWVDGKPMQGLTGGDGQVRTDYVITGSCEGNENFSMYVEMAANGMFGAGGNGMIQPPDPNKYFNISMLEVAVRDPDVYSIIQNLKIIVDLVETLPEDDSLAQNALQIGCNAVNCCQVPHTTFKEVKEILKGLFRNEEYIKNSYHYTIHAIGHCHIDTAWLWPYAETERKCGRSWSSMITLMKQYPHFKFACSQAVQFDWLKKRYPSLIEEIKKYSSIGQFLYTGGTWVEMDGNIPSGEAFVRQFLYGQRFFKKEFGNYCEIFWLPDTFGYSGQLPQIIRQSGMKYFLTQKLSWSLINKFPHNSFIWQGIDGSRVLTHFPPADTYGSSVNVNDVFKTRDQNKEKGIITDGMLLYGYGDGGGGPTEDMIENLDRMKHMNGFPSIVHSDPSKFYSILEKKAHLLHTWVGELYLELHQGTFTSQALIKRHNRKCEFALRNTEFFQVWAYLESKNCIEVASCTDTEMLWKKVLLNQFHDVLPGTSINEAVTDAWKLYEEVINGCQTMDKKHLNVITDGKMFEDGNSNGLVFNTCAWPRRELLFLDSGHKLNGNIISQSVKGVKQQELTAVMVDVPSMGVSLISEEVSPSSHLSIHQDPDSEIIEMKNGYISASFNASGELLSCTLLSNGRECIEEESYGNHFRIFTDIPLYWDAWDVMPYNNETPQSLIQLSKAKIINNGPLRVSILFSLKISDSSTLTQIVSLDAESKYLQFDTEVDWFENRKMLKVEFPFRVHTHYATYEIQYGHLQRPTHCNTSWDWAKHEVCGHKWVDISEYDFGIALLNDCKYGFSAYGSKMQMSLLRSPKAPDGQADMGHHSFSYALMPYMGSFQSSRVIHHAYQFNNPLEYFKSGKSFGDIISMFQINIPAVIIDSVKLSEDLEGYIVIRLYESFGSHVENVQLLSHYKMLMIYRTNLLEERNDSVDSKLVLVNDHMCTFNMKPFELLSICIQVK